MEQAGSTLIKALENYLPHEQSKLQIISSKILDIFYEEFIKFVPAYILEREKEKIAEQVPIIKKKRLLSKPKEPEVDYENFSELIQIKQDDPILRQDDFLEFEKFVNHQYK